MNVVPGERSTHVMAVCCHSSRSSAIQEGSFWVVIEWALRLQAAQDSRKFTQGGVCPRETVRKITRTPKKRKKNSEAAARKGRRGCEETKQCRDMLEMMHLDSHMQLLGLSPLVFPLHANLQQEYLEGCLPTRVWLPRISGKTWNCSRNANSHLYLGRRTL